MSFRIRRPAGRRARRRSAPDRGPVVLGAAAIAALLAAGGALFSRRRRARRAGAAGQPAPVVPGPPSEAPVAEAVDRMWSCACGQEYRVQGEDRHRVYWLPDAAVSDPVLASECANCGRPLPREHEHPEAVGDA